MVNNFDYQKKAEEDLTLGEVVGQGKVNLYAKWTAEKGSGSEAPTSKKTNSIALEIDTVGPTLRSVELQQDARMNPVLLVEFAEDDFKIDTISDRTFIVERTVGNNSFGAKESYDVSQSVLRAGSPLEKQIVKLQFPGLAAGVYRLRVIGAGEPALTDQAGNRAGGRGTKDGQNQERVFTLNPAPDPSERVEFAEFQPTLPQPQFRRRINAGDKQWHELLLS